MKSGLISSGVPDSQDVFLSEIVIVEVIKKKRKNEKRELFQRSKQAKRAEAKVAKLVKLWLHRGTSAA